MAELGHTLLRLARNAIAGHFGLPPEAITDSPELQAPGAVFVTLTRNGQLLSLIHISEPTRPY